MEEEGVKECVQEKYINREMERSYGENQEEKMLIIGSHFPSRMNLHKQEDRRERGEKNGLEKYFDREMERSRGGN